MTFLSGVVQDVAKRTVCRVAFMSASASAVAVAVAVAATAPHESARRKFRRVNGLPTAHTECEGGGNGSGNGSGGGSGGGGQS
ncbi:hypothetical protein HZH66_007353 [Vespula vulgaris]|uniref:Uncharacterized protein n=1 Tax=Vespula vulgaris TaxID=7454 RepID=A0A834JZM5_VESVU|nr:hypothetical protein HZH66_007353 [Vespula vulgaris]